MEHLKNQIQICYAMEESPIEYEKSIFLAGPTPRDCIPSWRNEAIDIFKQLDYNGILFIPESNNYNDYYDNQIKWELEMMNKADIIMFYIPRDLDKLPGLTTNVEYGRWENSGKIVVGLPNDISTNRYIEYCNPDKAYKTLYDTIKACVDLFNTDKFKPNLRKNIETEIPLYIWNTKEFQDWYINQNKLGNKLIKAKVNYVFTMPKMKKVFLWILQVSIWIKEENRVKDNEFILSRNNICSALLYYKYNDNILDTEIVIVKEFRSPVNNNTSYVYELPGGSSMKEEDNIDVIYNEIKEECGLDINLNRIIYYKSKQLMATLSIHKAHLYTIKLSKKEIEDIKKLKGQTFGVEADTEKTYVEVFKIKDLLNNNLLDWSNIGMIMEILNISNGGL